MECYLILVPATVIIVAFAGILYRRTRDVSFVVGCGALYYWSLYGAWSIILDKIGGYSGKNYHYLERKLFPIALDSQYLVSIALYALFIIAIQIVLLARIKPRQETGRAPIEIDHKPILIVSSLALLGSAFLMRGALSDAWALNASAYNYTRFHNDWLYTVHQELNRVALLPSAIGAAIFAAGKRSRYFTSTASRSCAAGYALVCGSGAAFCFLLGNRNELLVALLGGLLTFVATAYKLRRLRLALVVLAGLWFLYAIDVFRGVPVSKLWETVSTRIDMAADPTSFVGSSNEAFAAHFSMYGVLAHDVPLMPGFSLYSLACSIIPRAIWPDRPYDLYPYYVESVGVRQDQGFTIHHATVWYLNFGYVGVLLGALCWGLIWSYCYNSARRIRRGAGLFPRLFAILSPSLFVASIPPLVRAGPEGYKALLIDAFLIPLATLAVACHRWRGWPAPLQQGWRGRQTTARQVAYAPPAPRPVVVAPNQ